MSEKRAYDATRRRERADEKRAYDATRRRERADEERSATRRRVLDAAYRLFVANGYSETTMTAISHEAGVALQSVYKAGRSKAELLHMAVDRAVAGDDEEVLYADREAVRAIAQVRDPKRQVRMIADLIATTQERSAPIQAAYRQAAAVDATIAASLESAHRRRLATFTNVIEMIPREHLRRPHAQSAETAWALGSPEVFLLLRSLQGWDADRYRRWIRTTLADVLLAPSA